MPSFLLRRLIHGVFVVWGVVTAVFFVDLHKPWFYFWMYAGLVMRMVLCVEREPVRESEPVPRLRRPVVRRDPYGWANSGTRP